jgi:integrase/recombinase XerD
MPTRADARPRTTDLPGLLRIFTDELRAHNYSVTLLDHAERIIPRLFDYLRQRRVRDIRAVTQEHILAFGYQMAKTPTARGKLPAAYTMNSYSAIVRRFFDHLTRRGLILNNVALALPTRRVPNLPKQVLSEKNAHKLMGIPNSCTRAGKRDIAILETLYGSAVRCAECARLDIGDVDLKAGTLLVRNGKGKKDRVVPLTKRCVLALTAYLRDVRPELVRDPKEQALFLGTGCGSGRRLSKIMIGLLVNRYAMSIGLKLSPHGLRHACATHLLRGGADIRHVQRVLGHKNIADTARYANVAIKDLREVLERTHPREKPAGGRRRRPAWS